MRLSYSVRGLSSHKTRFNHHFICKKMHVLSQGCDSFYPFVWYVWAFDFAICWRTVHLEFSSDLGILLFYSYSKCILYLSWTSYSYCIFTVISWAWVCCAMDTIQGTRTCITSIQCRPCCSYVIVMMLIATVRFT